MVSPQRSRAALAAGRSEILAQSRAEMAQGAEGDLDDILQSALEDFDDEELETQPRQQGGSAVQAAAREAAKESDEAMRQADEASAAEVQEFSGELEGLMKQLQDPEFVGKLDDAMKHLSDDEARDQLPQFLQSFAQNQPGTGSAAGAAGDGSGGAGGRGGTTAATGAAGAGGNPEMDAQVAETLKLLSESSKGMEGMDPAAASGMGEDVMKKLMEDMEGMSQREDFGEVMDNLMHQLVGKDIMQEPVKKICDKFPEWLAENKSVLSEEDYERYGKQYGYFQRLAAVYETEPENHARVMELLQEMQETGAPPESIIKELAPGLEFGPDGMPVLPNMGPGGGQQGCTIC